MSLSPEEIARANEALRAKSPAEIVRWAVEHGGDRPVVSTNFRPYEAVLLHLVSQVLPGVPVLWVDHGYNRPATYRHAEQLRSLLRLNLQPYLPRISAAHRDAILGPLPGLDEEESLKKFSAAMKLEPFQRGMRELAPTVWITALRRSQNPQRAGLEVVSLDPNFGVPKVNPLLDWADEQMEEYLERHELPNEWDYFDPAKADEKRECGLHAPWGRAAVAASGAV